MTCLRCFTPCVGLEFGPEFCALMNFKDEVLVPCHKVCMHLFQQRNFVQDKNKLFTFRNHFKYQSVDQVRSVHFHQYRSDT